VTVIAYRDGVLAADSLTETDGLVVPGPPKIVRRGKAWVATAGVLGDCAAFERWVAGGRRRTGRPSSTTGSRRSSPRAARSPGTTRAARRSR
jgi:hypothetical protein